MKRKEDGGVKGKKALARALLPRIFLYKDLLE